MISRRTILTLPIFAFLLDLPVLKTFAASSPVTATLISPTSNTSAQIKVTSSQIARVFIEYGIQAGIYSQKTSVATISNSQIIRVSGLLPGKKYFFRIRYALSSSNRFLIGASSSFTTMKSFTNSTFAVQADPHMDENSDEGVYLGTLAQIAASNPQFLVDLGDIFMVDKLQDKSEQNIRARYELMKNYYTKLGDIPLKICLGNHDGELGYSKFNTKSMRKEYFPDQTGELAYYSFEGPNQLHVVLDPFTYTVENPKSDGWQWTLGKTQYDWLNQQLSTSHARYKFIYIHHLLYGDAQSRGGVEIAKFNEWGGSNVDGSEGFSTHRPGWGKPIHQLLRDNKVAIVFKGHDHLYAKQDLDGIVYQTVPQPSHPGFKLDASQYGYLSGKTVAGSGFMKVVTNDQSISVEFVQYDGKIADSYQISMNS